MIANRPVEVQVKGMHSKKIVTDANNKRAAFGILRIPITKAEFCAIRKLDKMFLTTTVFDEIPDGSDITKPVMITNKEVKSLIKYRAEHGHFAFGRVTYDWTWEYKWIGSKRLEGDHGEEMQEV